jgi:tetratricopeptide (TPR) repeat protein
VPSGAVVQPGYESGVGNDGSADGAGSSSNPVPTPAAPQAAAETPPAIDLSTFSIGPDLSNASLESEVTHAESPARAASLRLTEDARKELADGRTADALRDLGRAVSIDPGDPFEYFYLGSVYVSKKNCEQALTFLKRAEMGFAARSDWLGQTISLEGACYEDLGRTNEAAQAYQRALTYAPNNLTARVGYGRLAGSAGPVGSLDAPPPTVEAAPPPPAGSTDEGAPEESPPLPPPADVGGASTSN